MLPVNQKSGLPPHNCHPTVSCFVASVAKFTKIMCIVHFCILDLIKNIYSEIMFADVTRGAARS